MATDPRFVTLERPGRRGSGVRIDPDREIRRRLLRIQQGERTGHTGGGPATAAHLAVVLSASAGVGIAARLGLSAALGAAMPDLIFALRVSADLVVASGLAIRQRDSSRDIADVVFSRVIGARCVPVVSGHVAQRGIAGPAGAIRLVGLARIGVLVVIGRAGVAVVVVGILTGQDVRVAPGQRDRRVARRRVEPSRQPDQHEQNQQ